MKKAVFLLVAVAYFAVWVPTGSHAHARVYFEKNLTYSEAKEKVPYLTNRLAMASDDDDLLLLIPSIIAGDRNSPPPPPPPPPTAQCSNVITSDIAVNTRWRNTPSSCDYLIKPSPTNNRLPINVFATLTIDPGVNIQFAPNSSIYFSEGGRLSAVGTVGSRIRFESETSSEIGHGLFFTTRSGLSAIRYADLVDLGKENGTTSHDAAIAGVRSSAGLSLRDTRISGSETSGALLDELNITAFSNNEFFGNGEYGVEINGAQMWKLDVNSDYLGTSSQNGRPFVRVHGLGSFNQVEESATWNSLNAPYWIRLKLDIASGDITVSPGTQFVFGLGAGLDIESGGSLRAVGTPTQPILFVGEVPTPGYWDGILFNDSQSTRNRLENVGVAYGGDGFVDANVALFNSRATITNSLISNSSEWGICVDSDSTEFISGVTYQNNSAGNLTRNC